MQTIINLTQIISILADDGYSGQPFATAVSDKLGGGIQIAKRNELHTFKVIPQRWSIERSFAKLGKCRRLWKNCEHKLNTNFAVRPFSFLDA